MISPLTGELCVLTDRTPSTTNQPFQRKLGHPPASAAGEILQVSHIFIPVVLFLVIYIHYLLASSWGFVSKLIFMWFMTVQE